MKFKTLFTLLSDILTLFLMSFDCIERLDFRTSQLFFALIPPIVTTHQHSFPMGFFVAGIEALKLHFDRAALALWAGAQACR
jgi:hypothetical protein